MQSRGKWVVVGLVVGVTVSIMLIMIVPSNQPLPVTVPTEPNKTQLVPQIQAQPAPPIVPNREMSAQLLDKRTPVAGSDGYFLIVKPDGSTYLEAPDGTQQKLTDGEPSGGDPTERVERSLAKKEPRKTEIGQLVVTETGLVDVPAGAVITFIGKDKVVTHNPDGTSTAYYADGRIKTYSRLSPTP